MPFFSIILPTYNRASLIGTAIQSVIQQTFTDWELIIIDDGSTDYTASVVTAYTVNDIRVKYLFQNNAERSAARNNGISKAIGKYICFLDSDDAFLENHLSNLHSSILLQSEPIAIFVSGVVLANGETKQNYPPPEQIYKNYSTYFFKESIIPSRVCISKEILEKHKFDTQTTISEDTRLWVSIANDNYPVHLFHFCSTLYLVHENNSVNVRKSNVYAKRQITLQNTLAEDNKNCIDRTVAKQTINDCYWGIFFYYYYQNNLSKAIVVLAKSIINYPSYRFREKLFSLIKLVIYKKI